MSLYAAMDEATMPIAAYGSVSISPSNSFDDSDLSSAVLTPPSDTEPAGDPDTTATAMPAGQPEGSAPSTAVATASQQQEEERNDKVEPVVFMAPQRPPRHRRRQCQRQPPRGKRTPAGEHLQWPRISKRAAAHVVGAGPRTQALARLCQKGDPSAFLDSRFVMPPLRREPPFGVFSVRIMPPSTLDEAVKDGQSNQQAPQLASISQAETLAVPHAAEQDDTLQETESGPTPPSLKRSSSVLVEDPETGDITSVKVARAERPIKRQRQRSRPAYASSICSSISSSSSSSSTAEQSISSMPAAIANSTAVQSVSSMPTAIANSTAVQSTPSTSSTAAATASSSSAAVRSTPSTNTCPPKLRRERSFEYPLATPTIGQDTVHWRDTFILRRYRSTSSALRPAPALLVRSHSWCCTGEVGEDL